MEFFDLMSLRCPDSMLKTRLAIEHFNQSAVKTLLIKTVEPSLQRDLTAYLNAKYPKIKIVETEQQPITEQDIASWRSTQEMAGATGEHRRYTFSEDDIEGLSHSQYLLLQKNENPL